MKALVWLLIAFSTLCWSSDQAPRSLWDWSTEWSDEKYDRQVKKADKAINRKQWKAAIRLGENALAGCLTLYTEQDLRCIVIMKNNTVAYSKTGSTLPHAKEITYAYNVAKKAAGTNHFTTGIIREIYRQLLMDQERYLKVIPLVIENIEAEKALQNDEFKILDWEILLYSLYKVEEQQEQQEPTLLRMLALTEKLIGVDSDNFNRVAITLADNYCDNDKYNEFFELVAKYQLNNKCLTRDKP